MTDQKQPVFIDPEWIEPLQELEKDAMRYRYLRGQDLETIKNGGIFAGLIPDNIVINGDDLDEIIDKKIDDQKNE